jgi:carboxypeptidase Taq
MSEAWEAFREYQKKMEPLQLAQRILSWDLRTTAPKDSVESKMQAISYFATELFRMNTSKEYTALLDRLAEPEEYAKLEPAMQLTVDRYRKRKDENKRIPQKFYTEFTTMRARCEKKWEEAKQKNDYSIFEPWLKKNIEMTAEYIHYLHPEKETYEALLSQWVEGIDCATVEKLFDQVKEGLVPLLQKIQAAPKADLSALEGTYEVDRQKKVQRMLLEYIGFDYNGGTTGESMHGLTGRMGPGDVRITNHFNEKQPINGMFTAIHEGGHGIYEQGVDPKYADTAVSQLIYSDIHESQSRFFENILGRNINFWKPIYGKLGELLPQFRQVELDTFDRAINNVQVSQVRTEADEVTYCLHIILRFELEKEIFRDHLPVEKLRERWNEKTQELLGITPEDDAHGILQDLHWSSVYFGYFPTYLLGSIYDGMYLEALKRDMGDVDAILREGRIQEITAWLRKNIHAYGSMYNAGEVIQRVCGKEISAQPLLDYFNEKYTRIYQL